MSLFNIFKSKKRETFKRVIAAGTPHEKTEYHTIEHTPYGDIETVTPYDPESIPIYANRKEPKNLGMSLFDAIDALKIYDMKEIEKFPLSLWGTQRAKENDYFNFANALISAFDCSHDFWSGTQGLPHYTGPLFTMKNYHKAQDIFDASSESDLLDDVKF